MRSAFLLGSGVPAGLVSLTVAASLLSAASASAEPRTLYKPRDIENARENLRRYPWAREILEEMKRRTEFSVRQEKAFFDRLIPELTPTTRYGQQCPACYDKRNMWVTDFRWSVTKPDEMRCPHCDTVYPNEKYPETGRLELPRTGQVIEYYQTPEERAHLDLPPPERAQYALKGFSGRRQATSFSGVLRRCKAMWAAEQVAPLAKLYTLTGDVAYAERAAWILNRLAEVFPRWLWSDYNGYFVDMLPSEAAPILERGLPPGVVHHAFLDPAHPETAPTRLPGGFFGGGRVGHHGSDQGWLTDAAVGYDLIRGARYHDGRRVIDEEMDRRIVNDLLLGACQDWENWGALNNMAMGWFAMSAAVGCILEQPERVRRGLDGLNRMLATYYHFDGFYTDAPGYAMYNFSNLRDLPDILAGYSDPPGYLLKEGPRLENLNPYREGHFGLALQHPLRLLAPGNEFPVIDHTHHGSGLRPSYVEMLAARLGGDYAALLETLQGAPLSEKGSEYSLWYRPADLKAPQKEAKLPLRTEWFPGWHVGVLRGGREANDTALYLAGTEHSWEIRTGHRDFSILSLSYHAFGRELAFDYGYFSGSNQTTLEGRPGQYWTRCTGSHNGVVVDDRDQPGRAPSGTNLELFGAAPGIEVAQAAGFNVYPQCDEYRRTNALIRTPDGQTYAVDLFRVKGGRNHKYGFQCNGSLAGVDPERPAAQPVALPPTGIEDDRMDWTTWVKNPRALTPEAPSTFTWKSGDVSLDLRLLNARDSIDRILIVDAPGWRAASGDELRKPPVQKVYAEHGATDPGAALATQYAAVMVPYKSAQSPVVAARLLTNDPESGAIAVEVKLADRTDYIISTKDQQRRQFGPVTVSGEFAFVSLDTQGRVTQGYLLGGTLLECGDFRISLPEAKSALKVRSVSERTLQLAEPLPAGVAAPGTYVLAPGGQSREEGAPRPQTGFEVESTTADTITVRDYPLRPCEGVVALNSRWVSAKP